MDRLVVSQALRHIRYLSGTRADFGLMQTALQAIATHESLRLDVIVTGSHLSSRFGFTANEIEAAGLRISARIPVDMNEASGASMASNLAITLQGAVEALQQERPAALLLLGDRGEMMAGALAALHLNIPVVHLHGGERSGTVDESMRHAISKLSHHHFVATRQSRDRLISMGEHPACVHVTGAPGIDGLAEAATKSRASLCREVGFNASRRLALFVYHPVVQEAALAADQARALLDACREEGLQVVALMPNADAGGNAIRAVLNERSSFADFRVMTHLPRPVFVSWMACCDVMVGNSSSGIIEAASFGTPVVNVGSRQHLRERNANVIDVAPGEPIPLRAALDQALRQGRFPASNLYGDGRAAGRIATLLTEIDLSPAILNKSHAY